MDVQQLYNQSAMLKDALTSKANQSYSEGDKQKFQQLASDQQAISERLKPQENVGDDSPSSPLDNQ